MGRSFSSGMSSAAAAAPAREAVKIEKPAETHHVEAPAFSSLDTKAAEPASGGSKKGILIAAVVVLAAALGYVGYTKLHPANEPATLRPAAPAQSAPLQPQTVVPQSANPAQQKSGIPTAASPLQVRNQRPISASNKNPKLLHPSRKPLRKRNQVPSSHPTP